jgi:hypothetical protein
MRVARFATTSDVVNDGAPMAIRRPLQRGGRGKGSGECSEPAPSPASARLLTRDNRGDPLPGALQARMQAWLGHDFSRVRVHTNSDANQAAREVGAVAFTMGDDIVLGTGADRPGSAAGDRLLVHELAHVVQQRQASSVVDGVSAPGDTAERAAHAMAAGDAMVKAGSTVAAVQRQATPGKEKPTVSTAAVQAALTDYLTKIMQEQGSQTLQNTEQVKQTVLMLFRGNPMGLTQVQVWLEGKGLPGSPAEFAAQVTRFLPHAIPAENLEALQRMPVKQPPDRRPKTAGEAVGAATVDSVVTPLARALKLSKDQQDRIIDAARSAVADGIVALVDQVMAQMGVDPQAQNAIHNAVDGLLKLQPGKAGDRQQEGAGSPYRIEPAESHALTVPKAPGEHIFKLPPIKWDFPGVKPPPRPSPPQAAPDPRVESAVVGVDQDALIPADVRGTAKAADYADAKDFARDVARKLDAAQKSKNYSVFLELGAEYATVKDRGAIFQSARQIILAVRDALPHKASEVTEVWLTINGQQVFRVLLHP